MQWALWAPRALPPREDAGGPAAGPPGRSARRARFRPLAVDVSPWGRWWAAAESEWMARCSSRRLAADAQERSEDEWAPAFHALFLQRAARRGREVAYQSPWEGLRVLREARRELSTRRTGAGLQRGARLARKVPAGRRETLPRPQRALWVLLRRRRGGRSPPLCRRASGGSSARHRHQVNWSASFFH